MYIAGNVSNWNVYKIERAFKTFSLTTIIWQNAKDNFSWGYKQYPKERKRRS